MNEQLRPLIFNGEVRKAIRDYWSGNQIRNPWGSDDNYTSTFAELGYEHVIESMREKVKQGDAVYVLDLMSYGKALRRLSKTEGLAVGIAEFMISKRKQHRYERGRKKFFIEGDVLDKKTWLGIDSWLQKRNTQFDLIVCRAGGAVWSVTNCKEVHFILLERMYERLKIGGSIFTDSDVNFGNHLAEWVKIANAEGIYAKYAPRFGVAEGQPTIGSNDILRIDRLDLSPHRLPLINKEVYVNIPPRTDLNHW